MSKFQVSFQYFRQTQCAYFFTKTFEISDTLCTKQQFFSTIFIVIYSSFNVYVDIKNNSGTTIIVLSTAVLIFVSLFLHLSNGLGFVSLRRRFLGDVYDRWPEKILRSHEENGQQKAGQSHPKAESKLDNTHIKH